MAHKEKTVETLDQVPALCSWPLPQPWTPSHLCPPALPLVIALKLWELLHLQSQKASDTVIPQNGP